MKTLKLMALIAVIGFATACGSKNETSAADADSTAGPGIGAAPSTDAAVDVDSAGVRADSTGMSSDTTRQQ